MSTVDQIKRPNSRIFRRASIKRRILTTGLFETDWQDISTDVKKWGTYKVTLDSQYPNRFQFANATMIMANDKGLYNPEDDELSIWFGYLSQQRTLVKIEAGFIDSTQGADGIWINDEYPGDTLWDVDGWDDAHAIWDGSGDPTMFTGIISGDINLSNRNEVAFSIRPLTQIFRDYAAKNLRGWTSTGMTASQFMTMLRDQTDGSSGFVFRPFLGDTTSNWDISTTTNVFSGLNTSTAKDVIDQNVWDIVEKLAEAENFVPYVTRAGVFRFVSRTANTSTVAYEFHGSGSFDSIYGISIKSIESFGKKSSKFYSRVQMKWVDSDTATSYEVKQTALVVGGANNPWNLGERSLELENFFIPTSTVAQTIVTNIFNDYSSIKNEIAFTTSFVPTLDILDRVSIFYDSPPSSRNTLWDQNDWADDTTSTSTDLKWELATGDAIRLEGEEFKFLSIAVNLDKFETKFEAREI